MLKNDCSCMLGPAAPVKWMAVLLWLLCPALTFAQSRKITGIVVDESDQPVSRVTILVKESTTGTASDNTGKFAIQATPGAVLVFSSVNYETREVVTGANTEYRVILKSSAKNTLEDVVVVGFGTVRRKDLTGSVASVNMSDVSKAPVKSIDDALQGRVAGVVVQSSDGSPGSNANIVIRGTGSITQDASPLYVIDGFPSEVANFNALAPADIESIDILKDAASTAIYGSRGSNGIIVVTTKRGKASKPQLNYNSYIGWQSSPKKVKMMNPQQYVDYISAVNPVYIDSTFLMPPYTVADYGNPQAHPWLQNVNWQNEVYRTGINTNHELSIRGGNNDTKYSLSGNYINQDGIIKNTGFKRYQGRFAIDQTINTRFKLGINSNYSYTEVLNSHLSGSSAVNPAQGGSASYYASGAALYPVLGYQPTAPLKDTGFNLLNSMYTPATDAFVNIAQSYAVNPLINILNQNRLAKTVSFNANGYLEYKILKSLTLRINGGYSSYILQTDIFNNTMTQSGSRYNSSGWGVNGSISFDRYMAWNNDNFLTYRATFNKNHNLTVMAGVSATETNTSSRGLSAYQLPNPELGLEGLGLASPVNTTIYSSNSRNSMVSGYSRVNYDYKGKYLLSASVRADGSSKFAAGNQWGYFPGVTAGWRFSREAFMKKIPAINDAKLRISYGASGNNRVGDYASQSTFIATYKFFWYSINNQLPGTGTVISQIGNPNLKWETNYTTDIGLDLVLLKSRITFTADYYYRQTKDLLLNASLPYATSGTNFSIGPSQGYKNVGSLLNEGLEFSLNTINVKQKNFNWSSSFNIAFNRNKILSLAEQQSALLVGSGQFFDTQFTGIAPYIAAVGRPIGDFYGLIFDGVYQYADFDRMPNGAYVLKPTVTAGPTTNTQPGDIKYKDLNGDGVINQKDYTVIGNGIPRYTGGFTNNIGYKNFDLNVLLQFSVGNDVINANRYVFEGGITANNPALNQMATYVNRWSPTNPNNALYRPGGFTSAQYSSRVVEDGSYLKLRTVQLGYTLPKIILNRWKIASIRVYAGAQNLLTWTKYSGADPEASGRQGNLTPGFDYVVYPHSLNVVTGINVSF